MVTLLAGLLLAGNAHAQDEPPEAPAGVNPAVAGFDVVILRPLGLAALAVGTVAFIPVAVLTAPDGLDSLQAALEIFVTTPAEWVFKRPLGDF
jgi:hypothetical protein